MSKKGKWTNEVNTTKDIIKSNEFVTKDGEIIELHDSVLENIAMDIVNYKEAKEEIKTKQAIYYNNKSEFENNLNNTYGSFYFNFYKGLPVIERQYLFRFIYLCTYLKYNDTKLYIKLDNKRYKAIKEIELMDILKLKTREYQKTKTVLKNNNLIYVDDDKNIRINKSISIMGNVENNKKDYIRIFKEGIRNLYINSLPREHKKLALFVEILPYINYNYNIICKNPNEKIMENIEPLNVKELSNILDIYKNKNTSTLKTMLLNTFVGSEKVAMIVKDYNKEFFIINPRIYYKGNDIQELNYLLGLFNV